MALADREAAARMLGGFAEHAETASMSPFYAVLTRHAAEDALAGGPCLAVVEGWEHTGHREAMAIRLLGGVHRLVLAGDAPALAAHYPSVGGDGDAEAAWPAFREVVGARREELRLLMEKPPQTNEVGRALLLRGALRWLAAVHGVERVRLLEIGASAGLCLNVERLPVDETLLPLDLPAVEPEVVSREGCDLDPVDPATPDGRLTLMSYVWPDMSARLARLRAALDVAAAHPVAVRAVTASTFLAGERAHPGTTTVLWHSVMWQYLPPEEASAVLEQRDRLAAEATAAGGRTAFAHVSFEPDSLEPGHAFVAEVRWWGDGASEDRVIATAPPHGVPPTWLPLASPAER